MADDEGKQKEVKMTEFCFQTVANILFFDFDCFRFFVHFVAGETITIRVKDQGMCRMKNIDVLCN